MTTGNSVGGRGAGPHSAPVQGGEGAGVRDLEGPQGAAGGEAGRPPREKGLDDLAVLRDVTPALLAGEIGEVVDADRCTAARRVQDAVELLHDDRGVVAHELGALRGADPRRDRKSTRLNSSHGYISYAVFCLKKKKKS